MGNINSFYGCIVNVVTWYLWKKETGIEDCYRESVTSNSVSFKINQENCNLPVSLATLSLPVNISTTRDIFADHNGA